MICGVFSLFGQPVDSHRLIPRLPEEDGLTFHPVDLPGFSGGFFLHERLPSGKDDLFYYDRGEDIIVIFSGHIYNKPELSGIYNFSVEDREPYIAAMMFMTEGPGFVSKLNGDFSIFIGQPGKRTAYLFRDHLGVRPLAWYSDGKSVVFSDDITLLCSAMANGRGPVSEFLLGFFKYVDYSLTPNPEVKRVMPGHFIQFHPGGKEITTFWRPEELRTMHGMDYEMMLSDLRHLLSDAVAIRCDRRYSAGAHVSSGLDSAMVALLASGIYSGPGRFYGFSWSPEHFTPPEVPYDERDRVRSLCSGAGIEPVFSDITPDRFLGRVSGFFRNKGYFIEEDMLDQAVGTGTNLIFSGWGGDEFISTGDRGIETDLLRRLRLGIYFRRNPVRPLKRFVKYFLEYTLFPALGILSPNVARSFADDARYLKKPFRKSGRKALRNFYFHTSRRQLHLRYLKFYHLQERCETWYTMAYRRGIEYRFPLLDRRIIEYMIKIPSVHLCRENYFRPLLRILGEGIIPDDVRLSISKKDHVYSAWWKELIRYSGRNLTDEAGKWSRNPDLAFVDFDLLHQDIARYRSDPGSVNQDVLFKALVYIKAVLQFSISYREEQLCA